MSRTARINLVKQALRQNKDTRTDQKALVLEVWKLEGCRNFDDVRTFGSSPSGILRDRRRKEITKEFPRDEDKYDHFKSYTDEFSKGKAISWLKDNESLR